MGARRSAGDIYSLQSYVKMARAKLIPIHFRTTWIENTQLTRLLNIAITFNIFAQIDTGWQKNYTHFDPEDK